jgi:hypothetical protein
MLGKVCGLISQFFGEWVIKGRVIESLIAIEFETNDATNPGIEGRCYRQLLIAAPVRLYKLFKKQLNRMRLMIQTGKWFLSSTARTRMSIQLNQTG